jgi:poly-gamma-glutamate synthesis protein (capsule biosynthesis protein)
MIIIGDIALADHSNLPKFIDFPASFRQEYIIANLEGQIVSETKNLLKSNGLFNEAKAFSKVLESINIRSVGIANNHIFDVGSDLGKTFNFAKANNIKIIGSKKNAEDFNSLIIHNSDGSNLHVLNYGDATVGCFSSPDFNINIINIDNIIRDIEIIKQQENLDSKIILLLHWGIEFESIPTPEMRKIAHSLILSGVDMIVGCHSHCVMGYEIFNGKKIFYGIGNFLIQNNQFFNGTLSYPLASSLRLAVEFDCNLENIFIHSFLYNKSKNEMKYLGKNGALEDPFLRYMNFTEIESYDSYYKLNRRSTLLLAVIYNKDSYVMIKIKSFYNKIRSILIKNLKNLLVDSLKY